MVNLGRWSSFTQTGISGWAYFDRARYFPGFRRNDQSTSACILTDHKLLCSFPTGLIAKLYNCERERLKYGAQLMQSHIARRTLTAYKKLQMLARLFGKTRYHA